MYWVLLIYTFFGDQWVFYYPSHRECEKAQEYISEQYPPSLFAQFGCQPTHIKNPEYDI